MPLDVEKRKQIEQIFRKFLLNRAKTIRRLKMSDLDVNPFLIRILSHELGLDNSEAIVRWLVSQRLERGTVTSFGIALQDAAKVFSEGTGVDWVSGREFWEFISDDPQCLEEIYEITAEVGRTFKDPKGQSLSNIIEAKIQELAKQFERMYGRSASEMWKNLLEENS